MANVEQTCGQCVYFKQGQSQSNPKYNRMAGMLELLGSGNLGQLKANTGVCEAPYQTFAGKRRTPGFTTFFSQKCDARDNNLKILFQPKK